MKQSASAASKSRVTKIWMRAALSLRMAARAFTPDEFTRLENYFAQSNSTRNLALFLVGCATGLRITELLSLRVEDVWSNGLPNRELRVERRRLKGGRGPYRRAVRSRRIPLGETIRKVIAGHVEAGLWANPTAFLFAAPHRPDRPISRWHAHRILLRACQICGVPTDRISNHSYRKFFAQNIYAQTKDLLLTQAALAHSNPPTTARYIATDEGKVDAAILALQTTERVDQVPLPKTA